MAQANTPQPPYYAAIFSSKHTGAHEDYDDDTETILELAKQHPGFLGVEAAMTTSASPSPTGKAMRRYERSRSLQSTSSYRSEAAKPTTRDTRCAWQRWSATTASMCRRLC